MYKKEYQKPQMAIVHIVNSQQLLAGSGPELGSPDFVDASP